MEENENQNVTPEETQVNEPVQEVQNTQETPENNTTTNDNVNKVVGVLKEKKKLIIGVVVALIAICVLFNIFFNTKGKAKNVISDFCSALSKGKYQKALKTINPAGMYALRNLDKEEYEDFWDEYKDYKKSDDWDDDKEKWDDLLEDAKDAEEDFDKDDAAKVTVKKVTKFKKVGKNLYEVKVRIVTKQDGDKDEDTMTFYVMKDGMGCKLVGGTAVSAIMWAIK